MSNDNITCQNPMSCGVKTHRLETDAKCMGGGRKDKPPVAPKLEARPSLVGTPEAPKFALSIREPERAVEQALALADEWILTSKPNHDGGIARKGDGEDIRSILEDWELSDRDKIEDISVWTNTRMEDSNHYEGRDKMKMSSDDHVRWMDGLAMAEALNDFVIISKSGTHNAMDSWPGIESRPHRSIGE